MLEARLFGLSDIRPELAFWPASVHLTRCCIVSLWQGLRHTERLANHGYFCFLRRLVRGDYTRRLVLTNR